MYTKLLKLGLTAPPTDGPAILIYDIETTPLKGWAWRPWEANVEVEQDSYMLSVAYKWYGQKKTHFVSIFQSPGFKPNKVDDRYLVDRLYELFDAADVLIAHNGDKFDKRKSNARFIEAGYGPPAPYLTIDTLKTARSQFAFSKNSLNDLARFFGLGRKVPHVAGMELWWRCMEGDSASWKVMEKYNIHDVDLLEQVYLKLRPWMDNHPNMNFWSEVPVCRVCGSDKLQKRGVRRTGVSVFQSYKCNNCGKYSKSTARHQAAPLA